jgi:hypothetical protein
MKKPYLLFILTCVLLRFGTAHAQCGINMLTNPGFDAPVQPTLGNNINGFTFNGWTMTGGPFNVVKVNGSAYPSGPDNAKDGNQYVDIASAGGTIVQDFTITGGPLPLDFGGYFSSRDPDGRGYTDWTGSVQIVDKSGTVLATSTTRSFTAADGAPGAQENWYQVYGSVTLPNGTYTYVANLGDWGNFDAAYLHTDCILPVRLNYFRAEQEGSSYLIRWKTEEQTRLAYFDIEKSVDGRHFSTAGQLNVSSGSLYSFSLNGTIAGATNYCRLKMVDSNGTFYYSNILTLSSGLPERICATPNPAKDWLHITGMDTRGTILLRDSNGMMIYKTESSAPTYSLDVSRLPAGMYVLQYAGKNQLQTIKFLKR